MSLTPNRRIHRIHQELVDIIDDPSVAVSFPQALLDRLKAMRGMLVEEMSTSPERDSRMAMWSRFCLVRLMEGISAFL
jgi:hypothetical protein